MAATRIMVMSNGSLRLEGDFEIVDPNGVRLAKAKYYDEDLIVAPINLKTARRQRVVSPLLRDENLDLTINELLRIRNREEREK